MRGKYSPTVSAAYMADQDWHSKLMAPDQCVYDVDGFDSYGYDKDDVDRAGNHEHHYYPNDTQDDEGAGTNFKYDDAAEAWGYDGVRPTHRGTLWPRQAF